MYRSTKNKLRRRVPTLVIVGALAAGATVAAAGVAGASAHADRSHSANGAAPSFSGTELHGPHDALHAGGLITALSATSLTVTNPMGTPTTYTLNSSTIVTKDRASASLSDLAVGEHVRVLVSAVSTTTATRVDIATPHALGLVVAVSGDVITLSSPDGNSTTLDVTPTTTYMKNGASASLSDVTVGSFVAASGTLASDHTTFDAASVVIGVPAGPMGAGSMGDGPMGDGHMGAGPIGAGPWGQGGPDHEGASA